MSKRKIWISTKASALLADMTIPDAEIARRLHVLPRTVSRWRAGHPAHAYNLVKLQALYRQEQERLLSESTL